MRADRMRIIRNPGERFSIMSNNVDERTPVLIGAGQLTFHDTPPAEGAPPTELVARAARAAAADAGLDEHALRALDALTVLRFYPDTTHRFPWPFGRAANPPAAVARRLGATPRELRYTSPGGNMPQWLVNDYCERIAAGELDFALVGGAEALRTIREAKRAGLELDWEEPDPTPPPEIGDPRRGWNDHEDLHGMRAAIVFYPLFENALRHHRGRSVAEHQRAMGRLFERFAEVAARNPLATRREGFGADEIAEVRPDNRMVGFPYPKLMNSNAYVDQAAVLLLASTRRADELGVPPERRVYLHGVADTVDHWYVSERRDYHSCDAMRLGARKALDMAGLELGDLAFFDLYSCFPSAVEIACDELGLAEDDPRGLTVTGGLPYFGGPGNNYVTHSIAEMMNRVRAAPGQFGLVTANGNFLTKHAFGIYGTTPSRGPWRRERAADYQAGLDARPIPAFTERPLGDARIETWTVMHGRDGGPEMGVVIGRLDATGERFVANTPPGDLATFETLENEGGVGRAGQVETNDDGRNVFRLAG